jgi:hypothetical protein
MAGGHFARMMREQGIAANATSRFVRGRNRDKASSGSFRAKRYRASTALRERIKDIAKELAQTGTIRDPARTKLIETRKAIIATWMNTADALDAQGDVVLAGDVRHFANHLPPVLTDKERLAIEFLSHRKRQRSEQRAAEEPIREQDKEFTR